MSQDYFETEAREELPNYCSFCGTRFQPDDSRCSSCNKIRASKKTAKVPNVPWKKILYERQPFEDNYLDETFLSSLIPQETSAKITYTQVAMQAMELSIAATYVSIYMLIFMGMLNEIVDAHAIAVCNGFILFTGSVLYVLLSPKIIKLKKIFTSLKTGATVIGFVFVLSPMLKTLFNNYADNTTYAISYGLVLGHLILRDYGYVYSKGNSTIKMDWSTLTVMFLSVILGSRLKDAFKVFTLWVCTLTIFVFSKVLQKSLREYSIKAYKYTAFTLIVGMGIVIYSISKLGIVIYVLVNIVIFIIGPLVLVWFYQYKNVIHGPWDLPDVKAVDE